MGIEETPVVEELFQFAREVIRLAGVEALASYGRGNPRVKFDEGVVTEAELRLNEIFEERIRERFPDHRVFPESAPDNHYSHRGERYLWIFNALDGVANFQAGIPTWGISLALLENAWPIFGLFYMPVTGDLFHARAGDRAYHGDTTMRVSSQAGVNDETLLLAYARFHLHYRTTFPGKIRDFGCAAAHVCYVAMGRAEAALVARETYRDLAAARIIVEAAGGTIFQMDGEEFFLNEYLDGQPINDHLLVVRKEMYPLVRECLQRVT